jgi:hypothetical protein
MWQTATSQVSSLTVERQRCCRESARSSYVKIGLCIQMFANWSYSHVAHPQYVRPSPGDYN